MYLIVVYRRANVLAPFLQPIVEAWLEEEIENGWIAFPGGVDGFIAQRTAAARCHWRGPPKPQADDLKFARACETLRKMGVITDEWICAELGDDWEDTYEQRKREQDKREQLGLKDNAPTPANPLGGNGAPGMIEREEAEADA
jgi:capsid protein